jgi:type IV secretory pathway TrbF-like protein
VDVEERPMNKMFRPAGQPTTQINDIVAEGQASLDNRLQRVISGETAWKRIGLASLAVAFLSICDNIYQEETKPPPTIVHVVHNSLGGVIAVTANSDGSDSPDQIQLKAAMQDWITDCRSIFVDINAMRRHLTSCAWMIEKSSQADMDMARYYNTPHKEEPFNRAATETVALRNVVAVPPTADTIGSGQHLQTWSVTWTEVVTSRDGSYEHATPWAANVTFSIKKPKDVAEADRNPNGIHITSYSWTAK